MTGAEFAQLLIILGPRALDLIERLVTNWKTEMPPEQVLEVCKLARKSREDYEKMARILLGKEPNPGP